MFIKEVFTPLPTPSGRATHHYPDPQSPPHPVKYPNTSQPSLHLTCSCPKTSTNSSNIMFSIKFGSERIILDLTPHPHPHPLSTQYSNTFYCCYLKVDHQRIHSMDKCRSAKGSLQMFATMFASNVCYNVL